MLDTLPSWGATFFLAASSFVLWRGLRKGDDSQLALGSGLVMAGGLSALAYMLLVSYRLGAFPIINPFIGASFLAFLLAAFAVGVWIQYREPAFLAGAAPVAAMFSLLASLKPVTDSDLTDLAFRLSAIRPDVPGLGDAVIRSAWFPAHVTLALSAYALFALAATMGLLQLALLRVLKNKSGGRALQFLPSLPVVEKVGIASVNIGTAILLVGIVIGAWGSKAMLHISFLGDSKEIAGVLVLGIYSLIELVRTLRQWPGRKTALAHVAAFIILLAVFMGTTFFSATRGSF